MGILRTGYSDALGIVWPKLREMWGSRGHLVEGQNGHSTGFHSIRAVKNSCWHDGDGVGGDGGPKGQAESSVKIRNVRWGLT